MEALWLECLFPANSCTNVVAIVTGFKNLLGIEGFAAITKNRKIHKSKRKYQKFKLIISYIENSKPAQDTLTPHTQKKKM